LYAWVYLKLTNAELKNPALVVPFIIMDAANPFEAPLIEVAEDVELADDELEDEVPTRT